jgi:exosortase/archaeosortase family protein
MERRTLITAIALLLAAIPTMRWYALRLQDGGGELAGLVPLGAALWFAVRDRKGLGMTSRGMWAGIVLLLIQAAAFPFLPAMIRALLMVAAVACVSGIWRKPGIVCLLVLALPWTASLDFFLGYPLRLLTSVNATFLLDMVGTEVTRSGVQLLYEGRVIGVDPACSGMNMLWSTGLLTGLLAAAFSLRWKGFFGLGAVALCLALAGNSLRAAILFFPEADIIDMPHILHAGIGVGIAGGCFFALMKCARRLKEGLPSAARQPQPFPSPYPAAECSRSLLASAALLVLSASLFSQGQDPQPLPEPDVLTSFQGMPVTRMSLNEAEKTFYRDFPGTIAVYETGQDKLILRHVNRATRKLHPASHCLRAEGFRIGGETVVEDGEGGRWLSYTITRSGETYRVREHITCPASGRSWPEISAWFWHAFLHPGDGPWQAVTVISAAGNEPELSRRR